MISLHFFYIYYDFVGWIEVIQLIDKLFLFIFLWLSFVEAELSISDGENGTHSAM